MPAAVGAWLTSVGAVASVAGHSGGQDLARRRGNGRAAEHANDPFAVDREVERLPHADVVEGGEMDVELEPVGLWGEQAVPLRGKASGHLGHERARYGVGGPVGPALLDRTDFLDRCEPVTHDD